MSADANNPEGPSGEQEKLDERKAQFEVQVMQELLDKYPEEEQKTVTSLGGMDIIACGYEPPAEHLQTIENGFNRIREKLGERADTLFTGLKLYLADLGPSGGQALARENAVVLNVSKMGITVAEMEDMLAPTGQYRKGDQSNLVGGQADAGELGFVHELGHILEFRVHGDYDIGFKGLDQSDAPTEYGQKSAREDYAESWMYYIYGGQIDPNRRSIIENDLQSAGQEVSA